MSARLAARGIDFDLDIDEGSVIAVLGPNGAGKSTLLQLIAGLLSPDDGVIQLGPDVLTDTSNGTFVPVHARGVATLSQDALLFPHMSVRTNVAFAPRSAGVGRADSRSAADAWLDAVDATEFAERRPSQLSGGQARRVAIARALAANPRLLLLDEPLAALDVGTAPAVRRLLRSVLGGRDRTALIVTHDLLDVVALADGVIVIEDGRIVERGTVEEVLTAPRSTFAARIAGVNLISGVAEDDSVKTTLETSWNLAVHGSGRHPAGTSIVALFSPAAVSIHLEAPHASPRNVFRVHIEEMEVQGSSIRVRATPHPDGSPGIAADVTPAAVAELGLEPGRTVHFVVKSHEVTFHPALASRSS